MCADEFRAFKDCVQVGVLDGFSCGAKDSEIVRTEMVIHVSQLDPHAMH